MQVAQVTTGRCPYRKLPTAEPVDIEAPSER